MRAKIRTTIVCREKCVSILIERKRVVIIFRLDNSDLIGKKWLYDLRASAQADGCQIGTTSPQGSSFQTIKSSKIILGGYHCEWYKGMWV